MKQLPGGDSGRMHVLGYLGDPDCTRRPADSLTAEYRLLCSGTLFREIIGDWSESEVARFLLAKPLLLYAASRPLTEYPLELVLQLTVAQVQERRRGRRGMTMTSTFWPDAEVARDFAALLTVLCRRLITVCGKSREQHAGYQYPEFNHTPMPVAISMRRIYWPPHPLVVATSLGGQKLIDYNPPPKPVKPQALTSLLLALPKLQHAGSIVASARLYGLALELIREQPDIAYQLLISCVETMANGVLHSFQPEDDVKVAHQKSAFDMAVKFGLSTEQARSVAIAACRKEHWVRKKFKKFLMDNVDDSVWGKDDLFKELSNILPSRENFERTLGKIYDARSKTTHSGQPFPAWASYSGGPTISMEAVNSLWLGNSIFPPVMWFERIVNNAIMNFWKGSVKASSTAPSSEPVTRMKSEKRPSVGPARERNKPKAAARTGQLRRHGRPARAKRR